MKVGLISPFWPPQYGGIAIYAHRLAAALAAQGFEVGVFSGVAADPERDNGDFPVTRWHEGGNVERISWLRPDVAANPPPAIFRLYRFIDAAVSWAVSGGFELVLVNAPLTEVRLIQARELFLQLKARGIRVGAIHHDLSHEVTLELGKEYVRLGAWEAAAASVSAALVGTVRREDPLAAYYRMGSPLFFAPDFMLCCSAWTARFLDPTGRLPGFVLHPPLAAARERPAAAMPARDVLMVNPQRRKGPAIMANLIRDADPAWTFRVIKGGWGDAFREFLPMIAQAPAWHEGRVALVAYAPAMDEVFAASRVTFFPSMAEGYGMTAIESLAAGVPVVASSHPAILEAVGDAARPVCHYTAPRTAWRNAVAEVLAEPGPWQARALERATEVRARETVEIQGLVRFLESLV